MASPTPDTASAGPEPGSFFRPPLATAFNHLLKSASWARARLKPFAGKTVCFNLTPFAVTLAILDSGEVENSTATGAPDASFRLTPGTALRVLSAEQHAWRDVQVEGDTELAREILAIAQNLRWDVEEDLSRIFGDIAAHRMVQAGNDLKRWQQQTGDSLARAAAAYWTEEQPLIATRRDIEQYLHDVDVLRDDVARTEKRLENLIDCQQAKGAK